jgi:hypothetical protein
MYIAEKWYKAAAGGQYAMSEMNKYRKFFDWLNYSLVHQWMEKRSQIAFNYELWMFICIALLFHSNTNEKLWVNEMKENGGLCVGWLDEKNIGILSRKFC